jgi:branched-chain amino acid transport system substrate-binding protein
VFATIFPYAKQFNGQFLLMGGSTRMHEFVGQPGNEFLIRTWNWDAGPKGFGEKMVDYLMKNANPKRVALLLQNDQGGRAIGGIYEEIFKARNVATMTEYFDPGTKDFSPVLAKISEFRPDYLLPGYSDAALYDIIRQATEGNYIKNFFLVRGSIGPGMKNKDGIQSYIVYSPKDFEEAEKKDVKVKRFVDAYKTFFKRDFPYDQAPLCSSSCYDHVYMLVAAMQKAGTVDDVEKIRKALLSLTYEGLWRISFDERSEEVFDFDIVNLKKGGVKQVIHVEP